MTPVFTFIKRKKIMVNVLLFMYNAYVAYVAVSQKLVPLHCNFMHYNFKSTMKFLEDVYFSIEYMYS